MAQNTVLAVGVTAATSTDVVVAAGATVSIGIFTDSASGLPGNHSVTVFMDTPSQDIPMFQLNGKEPVKSISSPGTYRARRGLGLTTNVGVFTET